MTEIIVNQPNQWRLQTPGGEGRKRSARDEAKKFFMVSADSSANEPSSLWYERIDSKYRERLPHLEVDSSSTAIWF
ncbi:MAG: hypothetical protein O7G88_17035 [bacterium]|nr:hypothetical protein [bacterium]